jgi:hypothetical protein
VPAAEAVMGELRSLRESCAKRDPWQLEPFLIKELEQG